MREKCFQGEDPWFKLSVFWKNPSIESETALLSAVCLTGNPGVVGYYRTFMQTLHSMFGYRHPVWAVSHAGHCVPPDFMDMVEGMDYSQVLHTSLPLCLSRIWGERFSVTKHTGISFSGDNVQTHTLQVLIFYILYADGSSAAEADVFGLDGQTEHKLAFLRKHVPRETSLVLVGHSIGCYIILDMMKRDPDLKVTRDISQSFFVWKHNTFSFHNKTSKHRCPQGGTLEKSCRLSDAVKTPLVPSVWSTC